jgi:Saf4/Yju2 protein
MERAERRKKSNGPKGSRAKRVGSRVRFALPFSVKCGGCGQFMPKGRKLNVAKTREQTGNGIDVFRFMFPCVYCGRAARIITSPEEGAYRLEPDGP